jgi:hypothetical protein
MIRNEGETFSEDETARRRDAVIRRMVNSHAIKILRSKGNNDHSASGSPRNGRGPLPGQ